MKLPASRGVVEGSADGRSRRWDAHRSQRRAEIVEAALASIREQGPDVALESIAERALLARSHMYRHFASKQELDEAVVQHVGVRLRADLRAAVATAGSPLEIIRAAAVVVVDWIHGDTNLWRFLIQRSHGSGAVLDVRAQLVAELTHEVSGYVRSFGADPEPVARAIASAVGMVEALVVWWLDHPTYEKRLLTDEIVDKVWLLLDHDFRRMGFTIDPALPATPEGQGRP